jgi:membrane fusion protein (multidrug efflux system)
VAETADSSATKSSGTAVGPGRPVTRRHKILRRSLWIVPALIVIAGAGILLYRHFAAYESTDDAQIDGYIYPVSSRVTGYVNRVMVDDNQYVQAGTVLVQLDATDYDVAIANAKAALANDQANAASVTINVPITSVTTSTQYTSAEAGIRNAEAGLVSAERQFESAEASLRQAEANDLRAQDDVNRYRPLAMKEEIAQQQYTQAADTQRATAAAVESARHTAEATQQGITQARARLDQARAQLRAAQTRPQQISAQQSRARAAQAGIQRAEAVLQQAELNAQYTTIVAPVSGVVGQRSVQPGQNFAPGQQMMTIVPLDSRNIWVTANFKETQLKHMRPGQHAEISVDTYGRTYIGHVLNIAGATGSRYSLLPPENATGNYVKVVQRIPVKIVFEKGQDPQHLLRPGMSVEPKIRVQ